MSIMTVLRHTGGLVFDAVFRESHESELIVTDNPVEAGNIISDHAYMGPLRLVIDAGVSDTPLALQPDDPFSSDVSRSRKAYEMLSDLQKKAEPFDVQTGLKLYKNMLCTNIRVNQDKTTANVFSFTAELREVIIVTTQIVTYPKRKPGKPDRQASKKREKGEVNPQQVADQTPSGQPNPKKQSLAKKLSAMIGGAR
jgi:hypothetical protein